MANGENEKRENTSEQALSEGKLIDQEPLEAIEDAPSRLAGNNQIPDFGDDTKGTLQEPEKVSADKQSKDRIF